MRPTVWPSFASEMARFTETVVLPTPPLPEPTAIRFLTPGMGSLGGCPGWLGVIRDYRSVKPRRGVRRTYWHAHARGDCYQPVRLRRGGRRARDRAALGERGRRQRS